MNLKAVIMAGGFGTRLKPLTDTMPKPLVPVCSEPVMAHIITLLCKNGIYDAAVTLGYMPEKIKKYFSDCYAGVNLTYYMEERPLGTAGGVKNAQDFFDDDLIVISGDCICDLDLRASYEYHIAKKADVTVLLKRSCYPLPYGVALQDEDGRITKFLEKPSWNEVFSDSVNTGIYIMNKRMLDFIPENLNYDFSRDLFPFLMKKGYAIYGYEPEGDWCDIGTLEEYRKCNTEALRGKYSLLYQNRKLDGCFDTVIGEGVECKENSSVINSVLFEGVKIGKNCSVTGSVLCENVKIGDGVRIHDGCVIGAGCEIEKGIEIFEDTVIPGNTKITGGEKDMRIRSGGLFGEDGIIGNFYSSFGIDMLSAIGSACAAIGSVGACDDGTEVSKLAKDAFLCGVRYGGGKSYDFKSTFLSCAKYINKSYKLALCAYFDTNPTDKKMLRVRFFDKDGLYPEKSIEDRIIKAVYSRFEDKKETKIQPTANCDGVEEIYLNELIGSCPIQLDGMKVALSNTKPCLFLKDVLSKLGCDVNASDDEIEDGRIYIDISEDCSNLKVSEGGRPMGKTEDLYRVSAISATLLGSELGEISLPYYSPEIFAKILNENGINIKYYRTCPSLSSGKDKEAREGYYKSLWYYDPLFAVVKLLYALKKTKSSLSQASEKTGGFIVREDGVCTPEDRKAALLRRFYEDNITSQNEYSDGVKIKKGGSTCFIISGRDGLRILTESYSVEAAEGAVEDVIKQINGTTL